MKKRVIRRVLVVQPYGIGDLLFITPVLRALRLMPGIEKVDLLLGSRTGELLRANPHVDGIRIVDKSLFHRRGRLENLKEVFRLGLELRRERYDLLLDYSLRGEYAFFGRFFLSIPVLAGFNHKRRGFFHNIRLDIPDGFSGKHVADFCCALAEKAGVPVEDRWLEFYISEEDRKVLGGNLERQYPWMTESFLAVAPGGGESWGKDAFFKRWPPEAFAGLIPRLAGVMPFRSIAVLGSTGERELGARLAGQLKMSCHNLCGSLSLKETVLLIERAGLLLANDGGLLHLAAARKRPLIGIYGPVDPVVYGPYPPGRGHAAALYKEDLECRPCYRKFRYRSDCRHRECLQALTPEEVFARLEGTGFFENHPVSAL